MQFSNTTPSLTRSSTDFSRCTDGRKAALQFPPDLTCPTPLNSRPDVLSSVCRVLLVESIRVEFFCIHVLRENVCNVPLAVHLLQVKFLVSNSALQPQLLGAFVAQLPDIASVHCSRSLTRVCVDHDVECSSYACGQTSNHQGLCCLLCGAYNSASHDANAQSFRGVPIVDDSRTVLDRLLPIGVCVLHVSEFQLSNLNSCIATWFAKYFKY